MYVDDLGVALAIHNAYEHSLTADELRGILGDNAERRISELLHARIIKSSASWFGNDMPIRYFLGTEGDRLVSEFQRRRDDVAYEHADAYRKELSNNRNAAINRKQQSRHDFKVAAFTVILTLFLEHFPQLIDFIKALFE